MGDVAIHVEGLGKQYHIGGQGKQIDSVRALLVDSLVAPFQRVGRLLRGQAAATADLRETFWALRDVSFDVRHGEVIGIIGRNGAGKSTLLKILSRITEPSSGLADIYGRVGSLLEVGTGFHPDLTGHENIYLNGAIIGMRRTEIDRKYDEIVAFSEIEQFINTPVKHYSSGMYLRLAFAVAAHLEPEVLLVDEVLAVGDAAFQKKCLGKMSGVAKEGRTVLFVSHNMGAITQLCGRALWLAEGRPRALGPAVDVVAAYLAAGTQGHETWLNTSPAAPGSEAHVLSARLLSGEDNPVAVLDFDRPFWVELDYEILQAIRNLSLTCIFIDMHGNVVFETVDTDWPEWNDRVREPGRYIARCQVTAPLLQPGRYQVTVAAYIERVKIVERHEAVLTFDISEVGYRANAKRFGVVAPTLKWEIAQLPG